MTVHGSMNEVLGTCVVDTCVLGTCVVDICVLGTCVVDICVLGTCVITSDSVNNYIHKGYKMQ